MGCVCTCAQCTELTGKLAEDLAAEGLQGRTVTLKLKTTGFEVRTRAATLPRHVSAAGDLLREALKLLRPELPITIRLMVGACVGPPAHGSATPSTAEGNDHVPSVPQGYQQSGAVAHADLRRWGAVYLIHALHMVRHY